MLRRRSHLYVYVDSPKRFDKTSLSKKKGFYNNLNMEDMLLISIQKMYEDSKDFKTKKI